MLKAIKINIPTAHFHKILKFLLLSLFIPNIPTIPTKNNNILYRKIFYNGKEQF
jgi:hypothetical protein